MKCLFCQNTNTEVIETRVSDNKTAIRRRRSCSDCKKRFTTYERIEEIPVLVIKRDKRRERFDRKKLLNGIFKAVGKTTVTADQVEEIVSLVEQSVASHLKDIDKVAYIRFSSVFRRFLDVEEFERELKKLS